MFLIDQNSRLQAGQSSTRALSIRSHAVICAGWGLALSCLNKQRAPWWEDFVNAMAFVAPKTCIHHSALMVLSQRRRLQGQIVFTDSQVTGTNCVHRHWFLELFPSQFNNVCYRIIPLQRRAVPRPEYCGGSTLFFCPAPSVQGFLLILWLYSLNALCTVNNKIPKSFAILPWQLHP